MSEQPISTRPLSDHEKSMREKFYASIVAQSELMDKLSGQLLTLELAIPGIYATMLKLVSGPNAMIQLNIDPQKVASKPRHPQTRPPQILRGIGVGGIGNAC